MAKTQGVRLDSELQERLKWLAGRKDRSMNYLITQAIGRYLEDEERIEREKLEDQKRLNHFLDTGEHISHTQMKLKLLKLQTKARKAAS